MSQVPEARPEDGELPESQHTRPGGECCTALLAEVLRRGRGDLDNAAPE